MEKKYKIIYADPPWEVINNRGSSTGEMESVCRNYQAENVHWSRDEMLPPRR